VLQAAGAQQSSAYVNILSEPQTNPAADTRAAARTPATARHWHAVISTHERALELWANNRGLKKILLGSPQASKRATGNGRSSTRWPRS
jgi:hypothetical protein